MVAITMVVASYAHQNPFEKNRVQKMNRTRMMEKAPSLKNNASNINVATLTKNSYWNTMDTLWDPSNALKSTYTSNQLESELQLSYTLTDTFGKTIYNYDVNNRYSVIEYKNFDPISHTFVNGSRATYTHGAFGSYTIVNELYDMGTSTWTPTLRVTYEYDNQGNQTKFAFEGYSNGAWSIEYAYARNITYFNNTRKIEIEIDSNYNLTNLAMEANYKIVRTFNGSGQITSIYNFEYNNNVAEVNEIDSVLYDGMGLPTTLIAYDPILLDPIYKLHNINWGGTFDPTIDLFENQPTSYEESYYVFGSWNLSGRYSTVFPDNFGSSITLDEEYSNNAFIPVYRRSYINDSHLNMIEESEESYDSIALVWTIDYGNKMMYQYDMTGNMTEAINQQYQNMAGIYVNNQRREFSDFINIVAGVNSTKTLETKLYPNPSSNGNVSINLNLEKASAITIEVIDLNGRIINSQNQNFGQGLNTIALDGLKQGLYFVVISSDYGVSRTKLLVK